MNPTNSSNLASESSNWELALVTAPSSNGAAVAGSKLVSDYDMAYVNFNSPSHIVCGYCCLEIYVNSHYKTAGIAQANNIITVRDGDITYGIKVGLTFRVWA